MPVKELSVVGGPTLFQKNYESRISDLNQTFNGNSDQNKKRDSFHLQFKPQFEKNLVQKKVGDKIFTSWVDRKRSTSIPTDRLFSKDRDWEYKVTDKTVNVKSQLDNQYPWQVRAVCKVVKNENQSPLLNRTMTLKDFAVSR